MRTMPRTLCITLLAVAAALAPVGALAVVGSDLPPSLRPEEQQSAEKLAEIADNMRRVAQLLSDGETGPITQERQEEILRDITELLGQMSGGQGGPDSIQQQSSSQENQQDDAAQEQQSHEPSSAAQEERAESQMESEQTSAAERHANASGVEGTGAGGQGPGGIPRLAPGRWGDLPPRAAEELENSLKEHFLERYRYLLRLYFGRLSEEERP